MCRIEGPNTVYANHLDNLFDSIKARFVLLILKSIKNALHLLDATDSHKLSVSQSNCLCGRFYNE